MIGIAFALHLRAHARHQLVSIDGAHDVVVDPHVEGAQQARLVSGFAILLAAFPLTLLLCRAPDDELRQVKQRRLVRIGSAPILLLGLGWLAERVFGLSFMPI